MESDRPFGRQHRLRTRNDIALVRDSGRKFVGRLCVVGAAVAPDGCRRVVFITSRRYHKHAVVRNRARRLFREAPRRKKKRLEHGNGFVPFPAFRLLEYHASNHRPSFAKTSVPGRHPGC